MKNTTKKLRKDLERCVDTSGEPDSDSVHDQSDMYELRTCGNTPDCEAVLPLDRPGHYVNIRGERTLVCAKCYEFMGIFGGSGEDDETVYPYENY